MISNRNQTNKNNAFKEDFSLSPWRRGEVIDDLSLYDKRQVYEGLFNVNGGG